MEEKAGKNFPSLQNYFLFLQILLLFWEKLSPPKYKNLQNTPKH